ncbi:hypothetical protein P885DRAFT_56355 [Corynascus similis CBS 632.67]
MSCSCSGRGVLFLCAFQTIASPGGFSGRKVLIRVLLRKYFTATVLKDVDYIKTSDIRFAFLLSLGTEWLSMRTLIAKGDVVIKRRDVPPRLNDRGAGSKSRGVNVLAWATA